MNIKKLAPWNWFKNEEESGANFPVAQRADIQPSYTEGSAVNPIARMQREVVPLFEDAFRGVGMPDNLRLIIDHGLSPGRVSLLLLRK